MYVCICNAITERQIRNAAKAGVHDLWGLQAKLGVASNCGSCTETASKILREHRHGGTRAKPVIYQPLTA